MNNSVSRVTIPPSSTTLLTGLTFFGSSDRDVNFSNFISHVQAIHDNEIQLIHGKINLHSGFEKNHSVITTSTNLSDINSRIADSIKLEKDNEQLNKIFANNIDHIRQIIGKLSKSDTDFIYDNLGIIYTATPNTIRDTKDPTNEVLSLLDSAFISTNRSKYRELKESGSKKNVARDYVNILVPNETNTALEKRPDVFFYMFAAYKTLLVLKAIQHNSLQIAELRKGLLKTDSGAGKYLEVPRGIENGFGIVSVSPKSIPDAEANIKNNVTDSINGRDPNLNYLLEALLTRTEELTKEDPRAQMFSYFQYLSNGDNAFVQTAYLNNEPDKKLNTANAEYQNADRVYQIIKKDEKLLSLFNESIKNYKSKESVKPETINTRLLLAKNGSAVLEQGQKASEKIGKLPSTVSEYQKQQYKDKLQEILNKYFNTEDRTVTDLRVATDNHNTALVEIGKLIQSLDENASSGAVSEAEAGGYLDKAGRVKDVPSFREFMKELPSPETMENSAGSFKDSEKARSYKALAKIKRNYNEGDNFKAIDTAEDSSDSRINGLAPVLADVEIDDYKNDAQRIRNTANKMKAFTFSDPGSDQIANMYNGLVGTFNAFDDKYKNNYKFSNKREKLADIHRGSEKEFLGYLIPAQMLSFNTDNVDVPPESTEKDKKLAAIGKSIAALEKNSEYRDNYAPLINNLKKANLEDLDYEKTLNTLIKQKKESFAGEPVNKASVDSLYSGSKGFRISLKKLEKEAKDKLDRLDKKPESEVTESDVDEMESSTELLKKIKKLLPELEKLPKSKLYIDRAYAENIISSDKKVLSNDEISELLKIYYATACFLYLYDIKNPIKSFATRKFSAPLKVVNFLRKIVGLAPLRKYFSEQNAEALGQEFIVKRSTKEDEKTQIEQYGYVRSDFEFSPLFEKNFSILDVTSYPSIKTLKENIDSQDIDFFNKTGNPLEKNEFVTYIDPESSEYYANMWMLFDDLSRFFLDPSSVGIGLLDKGEIHKSKTDELWRIAENAVTELDFYLTGCLPSGSYNSVTLEKAQNKKPTLASKYEFSALSDDQKKKILSSQISKTKKLFNKMRSSDLFSGDRLNKINKTLEQFNKLPN